MQYSKSLTEFKEIYETWDLIEFYRLQAVHLAVNIDRVYKPEEPKLATKRNLRRR